MLEKGDMVRYVECSDEQMNWGGHDDPREVLKVGGTYEVERVDVRSWHTKTYLVGVDGEFNSVCFDKIS